MLFFPFSIEIIYFCDNINLVMLMKKVKQMSESLLLGILLAIVGGFLDAYTYIIRGGVFANAQTGNIVLLGINLAEGNFSNVIQYLIPILAFALGVLIAEAVKQKLKVNHLIHWRQIIIVFEMVFLLVCAFIKGGNGDTVVNVIISFVCALQVESFRIIGGNTIATTMCTGNLRSGTEQLFLGIKNRDKTSVKKGLIYYSIIAAFVVGAVIGAVLTRLLDVKAVLVACAFLLISFLLMFKQRTLTN